MAAVNVDKELSGGDELKTTYAVKQDLDAFLSGETVEEESKEVVDEAGLAEEKKKGEIEFKIDEDEDIGDV